VLDPRVVPDSAVENEAPDLTLTDTNISQENELTELIIRGRPMTSNRKLYLRVHANEGMVLRNAKRRVGEPRRR